MASLDDRPTTLTYLERYAELWHDMGLPMWQVCQKLKITPKSLYRMMLRDGVPVEPELLALVDRTRREAGKR